MKCYVIDKDGTHYEANATDEWVLFCQSVIDTDIVERVYRPIGRKWYNIILDESGKLRDNPIVTAIGLNNGKHVEHLVGTLVIFNATTVDKECLTLCDDDIINIVSHIRQDGLLELGQ